jgi:hypothetical protein
MFEQPMILATFVVVLIVCLRVLPEMGFTGFSRIVLAVCVAVLSAIGVAVLTPRPLGAGTVQTAPNTEFDFILLPYAALGLSLLILLLLVLLSQILPSQDRAGRRKPDEIRPHQKPKSGVHEERAKGQRSKK